MRVFALLVLVPLPLVKKRHEAPGLRGREEVWVWVLMRGGGRAIPPRDDEAADNIGAVEVLKRVMARCAREEREERKREAQCRVWTRLSFVPLS